MPDVSKTITCIFSKNPAFDVLTAVNAHSFISTHQTVFLSPAPMRKPRYNLQWQFDLKVSSALSGAFAFWITFFKIKFVCKKPVNRKLGYQHIFSNFFTRMSSYLQLKTADQQQTRASPQTV
ncbi:lectin subunit alpha [Plakobranchus ocellatus]|uniref:Lectin subunit alpha n=1 Tax=Plakobranchus ocellatus TaxID=259542 RepID=A0AAV3Z3U2_9GAST|nr:lectin subunit alpha [Plakobranchus ocellatus]